MPEALDEVLLRRFGHVRAVGSVLYLATVAGLFVIYGTRLWPMLIGVPVLAIVTVAFFMKSGDYPRTAVVVSLVTDLLVLAGGLAFFGGAGSGLVMLYSIAIVSAGILLGPTSATGFTILAGVVAVAQLLVEELGLEPVLLFRPDLSDRVAVLCVSLVGLASVGYLTETYASRLHELLATTGAHLEAVRSSGRRRRGYVHAASEEISVPLRQLELLADELEGSRSTGGDHRRVAAEVRVAATQLQAGVEMLADVGAMDTIRDSRPEPVLLARVVEDCLTALGSRLGRRTATVEVPPIRVVADRRAARRIVYNLVENVADHTPESTAFAVTAVVNAGRGVLVVSDDGPGMDPNAVLGFLERRPGDGPAAGLALVRELAEAMDALVRYERARGGGARFMVAFRLAPPSASAD